MLNQVVVISNVAMTVGAVVSMLFAVSMLFKYSYFSWTRQKFFFNTRYGCCRNVLVGIFVVSILGLIFLDGQFVISTMCSGVMSILAVILPYAIFDSK